MNAFLGSEKLCQKVCQSLVSCPNSDPKLRNLHLPAKVAEKKQITIKMSLLSSMLQVDGLVLSLVSYSSC